MKKQLVLSLIIMFLITACKKDKEVSLTGKWNLETVITKEYQSAVLINTNTEPGDGYKYDFQNNGNLLISGFLAGTTVPYTIISNSKVEIDGDIFEIRNLTGSNVTLFIREDFGSGDYQELFLNLKR
jgi:hypothetical protein